MSEDFITAVFGGTFDPVHRGHIGLAEFILRSGHADRIVFLPASRPPHKQCQDGWRPAPFHDRAEMLRIAAAGHDGMTVSELEAKRPGLSYTVDTLDILSREHPAETFVWVIGSDSLNQLHEWHEAKRLVSTYRFLTYPRPGAEADLNLLRSVWPSDLFHKLCSGILLHAPGYAESSTEVRTALQLGESPVYRPMLPDAVAEYIENHQLYTLAKGGILHV